MPVTSLVALGTFLLIAGGVQLMTRKAWARRSTDVLLSWSFRSAKSSPDFVANLQSRVLAIGTTLMLIFIVGGMVLLIIALVSNLG